MSVYFYCTAWVLAKNPEDLDTVTNEQLLKLAVTARPSSHIEEDWLIRARKAAAGKIESKTRFKIKIYAGESRGHALYSPELSLLHPELLFVEISGADCTEKEFISLIKNGKIFLRHEGVIPYTHELFTLLKSDEEDKNLCDKVERAYYDLIGKLTNEDFKDAIRQDEHEDFDA